MKIDYHFGDKIDADTIINIMPPIVKTRKILCKLSSFPCVYVQATS